VAVLNLPQKSVENAMKRMYVLLIALFVLCGCREAKKETKTSLEPTEISNISEELVTEESTTPMNVTPVNKAQGSTAAQNLASQTVVPAKEIASAAKVTEKITEKQSGPSGKDIQQALKNAGIYSGKVDGVIGGRTKKAIEDFQMKNKLKADGKVGTKTWSKLSGYLTESGQSASQDAPASSAKAE
jgi:murein L,D-transpeptidase YcbB/YkuD